MAFMTAPDDIGPLRLSTADIPERDRFAIWREVYGRLIHQVEIEPLDGEPFCADLTLRLLPGLGVASGPCSAANYRSTPQLIAQSTDSIGLPILLSGFGVIQQCGRETKIGPGETVVSTTVDPGVWALPEGGSFTVIRIARDLIAPLVPDLDAALGRPIPHDTDALRLLINYLSVFRDHATITDLAVQRVVTTHIVDLAALVIGARRDAAEVAGHRGMRAARLRAIKADVMENIGQLDFSVTAVAARHHVTPRHIHRLFESEGASFTEFVNGQKLARAYRMLVDWRYRANRISDIAYDAGFTDLSAFNRMFRRRYATTPSDVRNRSRKP
ncbi:transcriptional regulator, AraC family [Bradyrhizobium sp. Rc3b]|uniref:helix-turn-helix domain-containing protein n=1 Tax=unclassified Bradyrhizobium TaxID=2631580 RepID=UPI0008F3BACA|nr:MULTISPECIES: AraC family transcriptional regulator [unclassified Bradyrhizobium]MBB4378436.1 AraC-like DNA-binding protein [Bradyrhizobium sp. SBR1B]SFM75021.1 transcriptional regulator, AraC family [Bradyrhizobium sp. Rc3b]